jgi:hypothetical protein
MKLYDQSTMDLAQAVQDVLEGKAPVKEMEMKYPHDMFDPKTGKKEVAKDEAEHKALDAKGYTHEAPKENVAGPADLSVDQNVKKVQAKHGAVKKVDLTPKSVQEAYNESLVIQAIQEARQLKDPKTEVLVVKNGKVEVINKTDVKKFMAKGYELAEDDDQDIEEAKSLNRPQTDAEKKAAKDKFMKSADRASKERGKQLRKSYANEEDEEDMDEAEMSAKQAAYKKVFDAAMKKFGVKSPAELEDGKKKEFFDYVDANYDAEGEVEEGVGDFFNKAKSKVKKAADAVTGKKPAPNDAMKAPTRKLIDITKAGIRNAEEGLKKAEQKFKDKKISKERMDELDDYYQERLLKAETELKELEAKLKGLDKKLGKTN